MGTRSTTLFIEKCSDQKTGKTELKKICKFYRQMDGYPEGHGLELAEFLAKGKLVNGISMGEKELIFNGAGCLAAQVIAKLKDGPGGIYMEPVTYGEEEYNYTITVLSPWFKPDGSHPITITVKPEGKKIVFEGSPQEFINKYAPPPKSNLKKGTKIKI